MERRRRRRAPPPRKVKGRHGRSARDSMELQGHRCSGRVCYALSADESPTNRARSLGGQLFENTHSAARQRDLYSFFFLIEAVNNVIRHQVESAGFRG